MPILSRFTPPIHILNSCSCMKDLAQFKPAFNGVNTLLAVSTKIETEQITNGNLKWCWMTAHIFHSTFILYFMDLKILPSIPYP
jgi:hypothetical protein